VFHYAYPAAKDRGIAGENLLRIVCTAEEFFTLFYGWKFKVNSILQV
jgi:hypothetical protein